MSPQAIPGAGPDEAYIAFGNRLKRMQQHLGKWARRQGISCYRIYDHDLPDQPAVIDWYDGAAVVWTHRRTRDDQPQADLDHIAAVCTSVQAALNPEALFHKRRRRQSDRQQAGDDPDAGQYGKTGATPAWREVGEYQHRFLVDLASYLDVGLFLDHRPTRRLAAELAAGKRVLNLFAYTGSFTVATAAAGASTTTVDLSQRYLDWAQDNFTRNHLSEGPAHRFIRADCLQFVRQQRQAQWDLIICDPPTFSNSKAMRSHWSVDRDHGPLLEQLAALLRPQGSILFSTNSRSFRLQKPGNLEARDLTAATTDKDFERRPAHQCWQLYKAT
ncbi:MAG: methyltransferase domain-containing protein [Planctomycetota bacterium]|nr:MAG: methyltransferase domain-containing protein [Planctomycetota bacterium]